MAPERWTPAPPPPTAHLSAGEFAAVRARARIGAVLIGLGIAGILWGVFHMLGSVGGPEQRDFAHRQTYNEVKPLVQGAMFGSLLRAFAGLTLCLVGSRLRARP